MPLPKPEQIPLQGVDLLGLKWKILRNKVEIILPLKQIASNTEPQKLRSLRRSALLPDFLEDLQPLFKVPPCMIHPDRKFKLIWNIVLGVLLVYTATVMPYSMAFIEAERWGPWFILDIIIDSLFFTDVLVNIFSAYYDQEGVLVTSRYKIIVNYLKSWMLIDILACIPFSLIDDGDSQSSSSGEYNNLLRLLRLPRLYRLVRISRLIKMIKHYKNSEFVEKLQEILSIKHSYMRLIGSFMTILLCVHIVSCFWYFFAKLEGLNPDTWVVRGDYRDDSSTFLYFTSLYWAFTTLTTVGYGDIVPYTVLEKIYTIGWMMFGLYFLSFTIGSLSSILINLDTKENVLMAKLAVIDVFAKEGNLPAKIKRKLRRALRYSTEKTGFSWTDKISIFNELPRHLKYEVALAMHHGVIKTIPFFKNKDLMFISDIVPFLEPIFEEEGKVIYSINEIADEFYFIVKGLVKYSYYPIDEVTKVQEGDKFGHIEVLAGVERKYEAVAIKDCELLVVNKYLCGIIENQFNSIWEELKFDSEEVDENIERRIIVEAIKKEKIEMEDEEELTAEVERRVKERRRKDMKRRMTSIKQKEIKELKERDISNNDLFWMMENLYEYIGRIDRDLISLNSQVDAISSENKYFRYLSYRKQMEWESDEETFEHGDLL